MFFVGWPMKSKPRQTASTLDEAATKLTTNETAVRRSVGKLPFVILPRPAKQFPRPL